MERSGGASEEPQPDPSPEWTGPGAETGLEEATWQLGLGSAKSYPERPHEADCIHYLRTGYCGYGPRCRFNHPPDRGAVMGAARPGAGEYPERVGQPICQYYMRTGTCKFGSSCKFNHPKQGAGSSAAVSLNYYGYPLRPGEKDCSYYMKTGQCKFGATCKFHHPQPADIQVPLPVPMPQGTALPAPMPAPAVYPTVQSPSVHSSQQYGVVVARPSFLPYVQGPYGPMLLSPGMVSYPGWSPYQALLSPATSSSAQPATGSSSLYGMSQLSPAPNLSGQYQAPISSTGSSSTQKEQWFPQRPGQPECQHYIKTGECKFRTSCRYHHPPDLVARESNIVLSPIGLPLRPGAPICTHFQQRGVCKFGHACRFDHPMRELSYSPSASSLADMPVAPYPVGTFMGTLAPSSSSSDLRPELMSTGPTKEPSTSPPVGTTTASVGSILSKDESVSHSNAPNLGQNQKTPSSAGTENQKGSS